MCISSSHSMWKTRLISLPTDKPIWTQTWITIVFKDRKQVSVVMWLAPRPSVRESRVQIPSQHGNLVKFILVWVFFNPSGILTQTFTPPPTETRLLFNHGPQYGSAVCHHSRRSGRRPQQQNPTWEWRQHSWAEFPMMVIHHTHLPLHFFHRWRPSGGSWCCTTTHSDAIYNIHPT